MIHSLTHPLRAEWHRRPLIPPRGEGGLLEKVRVGISRLGLQTLTLFKTKSVHFATLFKTGDLFCDQKEIISEMTSQN